MIVAFSILDPHLLYCCSSDDTNSTNDDENLLNLNEKFMESFLIQVGITFVNSVFELDDQPPAQESLKLALTRFSKRIEVAAKKEEYIMLLYQKKSNRCMVK